MLCFERGNLIMSKKIEKQKLRASKAQSDKEMANAKKLAEKRRLEEKHRAEKVEPANATISCGIEITNS